MTMPLSHKALLVTSLVLTGTLVTFYTVASSILVANSKAAESHSARQSIAGVLNVLAQTEADFSTRFADWSAWDDTYTFIQDGNAAYIKSNLVPTALMNLQVDLALFVQPSGHVVFSTGFDRQTKQYVPVPTALLNQLTLQNPLLQQTLAGTNQTGLVVLPKGPLLLTARPILTSEGHGPVRGAIIFGRYLDAQGLRQLAKITQFPVALQPLKGAALPADFQRVRSSLTPQTPIAAQPLSEDVIGGYALISDLVQQPALLLRVEIPRAVYQQGQQSLRYLAVALVIIEVLSGGMILLLVQKLAFYLLERQRAENALQQAEEKYHSIFERAITGIFQTTPEGRYLSANPALAEMYGYSSPADLITDLTDIEHQLYVDCQRRQAFVTVLETQAAITKFEAQIYRKDGSTIWISETARAVRDEHKRVLYYEGFASDITETKQIETTLRESEERYALAIQGTNDGLWDWALNRNCILFSARWKAMLGYEPSELTQSPEEWLSRLHPEDALRVNQELAAYVEGLSTQFESEHRMQHREGHYLWVLSQGFAVRDADGKALRLVGSQTDITERKRTEAQLLHNALHDALTGLPNRILFLDRLHHAIQLTKRRDDYAFAVLFLDLDRFKVVNDSLGHMVGDQLLLSLVQRLGQCLRASDTFARLGGDEFVILIEDTQADHQATAVAERIQQALKQPFQLQGHHVFATASIGIIFSTTTYERPEDLLRDADTAMYRAKGLGRDRYQVFDPSMHEHALALLHLENDLRRALEQQEFQLHYQPILSLQSERLHGFEALVRWQHPTRGLLFPAMFIPVAEETGLILRLGEWVLREACQQMRAWQVQFAIKPTLTMSVNLASKQFTQPHLVADLQQLLQETGLSAQSLKLELTESTVMEDAAAAARMLQQLRALGMQLAIDDFGTGYSSLSYLHRFPVDTLKIDRSFVSKLETELENMEIIRTIVTLAANLGMDVVAEGIETQQQLAHLRTLNCHYGQGYLFSKPLDSIAVATLLQAATQVP